MKYLDEFRDPARARSLAEAIHRRARGNWHIMEVCGGQTHSIMRFRIDELLPNNVRLIHGPGCPVCVTSASMIDLAIDLAVNHGVILCSFGDMLRVPGEREDLLSARARGGDVRVVYSPLDALKIARGSDRDVVFFGVGFETTAPANAMAIKQAEMLGVSNFSVLLSHVLVPPALRAIMEDPENRVEAYLAAGHVCTVMGYEEYFPIAERYQVPIVVTGFEPVDLLEGILLAVDQLERGRHEVLNQYARSVSRQGNTLARQLLGEVFNVCDREWRGMGVIADSGWRIAPGFSAFDAEAKYGLCPVRSLSDGRCKAGEVLTGKIKPPQCPAFGKECTPETPLGATMVSNEGACAAYFKYGLGKEFA